MLRSLEIRNYRNLRHLTIEKLGRVNLLVGKNNTGKTSILEAVGILVKRGEPKFLLELIKQRGENYISSSRYNTGKSNEIIRSLSTLFTDRTVLFNQQNSLTIKAVEQSSQNSFPEIQIAMRLIKYIDERGQHDDLPIVKKTVLVDDSHYDMSYNTDDVEIGLEVKYGETTIIHSLNSFRRTNNRATFGGPVITSDFVRTNSINRDLNGSLWDDIVLTEKEQYVLQSLRIIENDINGLTFADSDVLEIPERIAIIRLKSSGQKIPLRSMGDGVNRILTIILSMVNCENGYLLIDEFENGLHYSVQEKLWDIIFDLAERLNIQVFATTHSLDCVEAFSSVLNSGSHDKDAGAMIRLENYEGNIEATVYDADEIQATTRVHVDPR